MITDDFKRFNVLNIEDNADFNAESRLQEACSCE